MADRNHNTSCLRALVCTLLVLLAGCADQPRQPAGSARAPSLHLVADDSPPGFRAAAQAALREAFPGYTVEAADPQAAVAGTRFELSLQYRNLTESEFETIWRTTTLFLLTLYPSTCNHRQYDMSARVTGPDGITRDYAAGDTTVAWVWLLQASRCGEEPTTGELQAQTRTLLARVLGDMRADASLDARARALAGPAPPAVRIVSNRAGPVVEQTARVERPFLSWSLAGSGDDAGGADYVMDLFFGVEQGSFSLGRGLLAIGTGGLSTLAAGICTGSRISLQATVSGPAASRTRSYAFSDSVATHVGDSSGNCEVIDETSRPDVFAALLKRVFDAAKRDRLLETLRASEGAGPVHPLVHVQASRAAWLVREGTIAAKPFPRYVFTAAGSSPDYTLEIVLQTSGGGVRPSGTLGQIASGAVFGLTGMNMDCRPTVFTLQARVADAAGNEVRRYEIAREFGFSDNLDASPCVDTEHSNPGAVKTLVRELYSRMRKDGASALLSGEELRPGR